MNRRRGQVQMEAMVLTLVVGLAGAVGMGALGGAERTAIARDAHGLAAPMVLSAQAGVVSQTASLVRAADAALVAERPGLVATKYAKMASSPFLFFRGVLPLYLNDWVRGRAAVTNFAHDGLVLSPGDAHPGNFGLLKGTDGKFRLETNDFDTVGRYPYLWDVRRLTTGVAVALRESGAPWDVVNRVTKRAARGYADTLREGKAPVSLTERRAFPADALTGGGKVPSRYVAEDGKALVRGVVGDQELKDVSARSKALITELMGTYAGGMPDGGPRLGKVLDVVALEGKGVSSLPLHRWLALVDGKDGATHVVEWKEVVERQTMYFFEPLAEGSTLAEDVARSIGATFAHPASGADWRVIPRNDEVYLGRVLHPGQSSMKLEGWQDAKPAEVDALVYAMGANLGQTHLESASLRAYMAGLGKQERTAWVNEQSSFARTYARRVFEAFEGFQRAVGTP